MKLTLKLLIAGLILFVTACKKDHNVLGVDVQPSTDELNAENRQNLEVTAHSLPYDSIASFNDKYKFIGSNNDPYFGRTDIGIYLNANISVSDLNFGAGSTLSSAEFVFVLDPLEYAGDKTAALTYSVFEMESNMNPLEIYFTSDMRRHKSTPVSVYTTTYSVSSSGLPVLRIPLDSAYATALMHDTPNLTSNDVFQQKYKGYYIAAALQGSNEGVIFKADLEADESGMFLHYKPDPSKDTIVDFKFTFTGTAASKYNTVKYTPKQVIKDQFQDSTLGATNLYIKGMGASKLKLEIPFLKNYSDSFKIAVNRAEVVLYVDPAFSSAGRYFAPPKLVLLSIDSLRRETYVQDLLSTTDYARYDGSYNESINGYVFNIAREAQLIFNGKKKNRGFYVVAANADITLRTAYATAISKELLPIRRDNYYQRVILAGSNNAQLKPRFNLNYIRFKND